jgi:hypothetical protein
VAIEEGHPDRFAERNRSLRHTVGRVAVVVGVAYVTLPVLILTVWVALGNLIIRDWIGLAIWTPIAGSGVAAAIMGLRGWRRHEGCGVTPLLPLLGWGLTLYALAWVFPVLL